MRLADDGEKKDDDLRIQMAIIATFQVISFQIVAELWKKTQTFGLKVSWWELQRELREIS